MRRRGDVAASFAEEDGRRYRLEARPEAAATESDRSCRIWSWATEATSSCARRANAETGSGLAVVSDVVRSHAATELQLRPTQLVVALRRYSSPACCASSSSSVAAAAAATAYDHVSFVKEIAVTDPPKQLNSFLNVLRARVDHGMSLEILWLARWSCHGFCRQLG